MSALYGAQSAALMKQHKCPVPLYLTLTSLFTLVFSYITAPVMQAPPPSFTLDPVNGLFGLFQT